MKLNSFRFLSVLSALILSAPMLSAQTVVRGGVVTQLSDNKPIEGVAVISSLGGGTVTDAEGRWSLETSSTDVLTFSCLGFADVTENVSGRTVINVSLAEDNRQLEEVVVLGYTSQKKNELSSSVVTLSSERLNDVTSSDLGNRLQGKVSGVVVMNASGQPGESAQIRVRGTGSISAGAGPLYVVDGIAGGSFNPNDVESLTVLKDASATALYGASAAGGVIVVTTKSAKGDKTTVNFKANAGIKKALTGRFSPMDSEELYYFQKGIYSKTLFSVQRPSSLLDTDFDWMDAAFKTGVVQNYYASASGKSGKTNWFASADWYDEQGSLINTGFNRGSARLNLSTALNSKLTMNIRLDYERSKTRQTSSYVTLECAYRALPWDYPYDEDGEPVYISSAVRSDNGKTWYSHDKYNMLHNEKYNFAYSTNESMVGDVQFNYNIAPWLIFTSTNRFASSNWLYEEYIDPRTKHPSYQDGYVYNSAGLGTSFGTTNLLKANHSFGDHSINGVVGLEYGESYNRTGGAKGVSMPAGQTALSNAVMNGIEGYEYKSRSWAALAQAQYSYKGKYIATASIRYDETSRFAPKARGGFFPGVSGAWIISSEDFMSSQSLFNLLKLRAGYGKTGNDNIEDFLYQDIYSLTAQYENIVAAVMERQANPNLGWEEAYMTSLGVDAELSTGTNVTIDLYDTKNTNLLLAVPQATSTGFTSFMDNVGTVRNRGVELAIDQTILNSRDWRWNLGFNVGFNRNRVEYLPNGEFLQSAGGVSQQVKVGQDIYSWYMPKWAGVDPDNGDPLWEKVNEDGSIETTNVYTEATYQVCGQASPKFSGGLHTELSWKSWTVSASGSFVAGNKIYNSTRVTMDSDGAYTDYNMMSMYNGLGWSRWEQPGDVATHPKAVMNGNKSAHMYSSRYLEDGSFFRLKNVTLSYELPKTLCESLKMSAARVYVSADNIFTLSRFSGMDPEVRLERTDWSLAGTYSMNYPVPLSVVGGIDINF